MVVKSFFRNILNTGKNVIKTEKSNLGHARSAYVKRENFKDKIARRRYPPESKGFKREGIFKKDSTMLNLAIVRGKRDGYDMQGMTVSDPVAPVSM